MTARTPRRTQRQMAVDLVLSSEILSHVNDGVVLIRASDEMILFTNAPFEQMLGYRSGELLGKHVSIVNAPTDRSPEEIARTIIEELQGDGRWQGEVCNRRKDGTPVWCHISVSTFKHAEFGTVWISVNRDITERRHAEQMQRRHERDTAIVNGILRVMNAHLDVKAVFPEVCAGLRDLAGCATVGLGLFDESREWVSLVASDIPWTTEVGRDARLRTAEVPFVADILAEKPAVVRDMTTECQYPIVQLTCDTLGVRSFISLPLCAADDVVGFLNLFWREVDGCQRGEMGPLTQVANAVAIAVEKSRLFEKVRVGRERLAALSRQLIEVQEVERRHLARELHDEVGQVLTALQLILVGVERMPPPVGQARLRDARQHLDELLVRVRDLSLGLRPAMLDDLGLLAAVVWLVDRYSQQSYIQMHIEHEGLDGRFAPQIETGAYRIVQEALTNVVRHAEATQVTVRLWVDDHTLSIQIIDTGKGFDPASASADSSRSGVLGMRERARLLGGGLTVESAPGAGTRVIAQLPV